MARTERSTEIGAPPETVFPYLFDEDKVPQWTTGLEGYERLDGGPMDRGARFRQRLEVSGERLTVELEVTQYDPPRRAESRFKLRGIDVTTTYALAAEGSGSKLTQSLDASGGGLKGRVLIPIIQPHLERKLEADLAALSALLA